MSWCSRHTAFGCLLLVVLVSGCGFRPLYDHAVPDLARSVEVAPIPGWEGEALRDALVEALGTTAGGDPRPYRIEVTLEKATEAVIIDETTYARRYDVRLEARYRLVSMADGRIFREGLRVARAAHHVVPDEIYAAHVSSQAALRRAARFLARSILTDVVLSLSRQEHPA